MLSSRVLCGNIGNSIVNNLLQKLQERFLATQKQSHVILVDAIASTNELAFMLGGIWDGCNSISLDKYDRVAISEASALIGAEWCLSGDRVAWLPRVLETELITRYQAGERTFINANLRCSRLTQQCLQGINLSYAFLNHADLERTDLSNAELSAADLSNAKLNTANLTNASLFRANLTEADLSGANLKGAKLRKACLKGTNLEGANLNDADLSLADLRGAKLDRNSLDGANLTGTILTTEQLPSVTS